MFLNTTKTLTIVNSRSGWSVVASRTLSGAGRYRDTDGRFATAAYSETRVLDRRIGRFSSLANAVDAVIALIEKAQPDEIIYVPAGKTGEEALLGAIADLCTEGDRGMPIVRVRRSILDSELESTPRTPFALAWYLARRAWFNDNCPDQDAWYRRD